VVPGLVSINAARFGRANVRFECLDIRNEQLPAGDLLLCKDVLQHWPVADIVNFCERISATYRYVLLTNDLCSLHCRPEDLNREIRLGEWRTLDLEAPPFNLRPAWRQEYVIPGHEEKRLLFFDNNEVSESSYVLSS
jgi:hypothetical protein